VTDRPRPAAVPWWAVVSSLLAPVALIGGWQWAAALQPVGYDPVRDTISALAAHGAHDRWVMTTGLAVLGVCHLVTGAGLRVARPVGRSLLAVGGVGTVLVAALPQPAHGSSLGHTLAATVAFLALACWPLAASTSGGVSAVPRLPVSAAVTTVLLVLLVVFFVQLHGGGHSGLAERLLAGAQSLWPAAVVVRARLRRG
jgi:hypothetical membrane protein